MNPAVNEIQRGQRLVVFFGGHANSMPVGRRCVTHPPVIRRIAASWLPFAWRQRWQFLFLDAVHLFANIAEQKPEGVDGNRSSDGKAHRRNHASNDPGDLCPWPALQQRVPCNDRRNSHRNTKDADKNKYQTDEWRRRRATHLLRPAVDVLKHVTLNTHQQDDHQQVKSRVPQLRQADELVVFLRCHWLSYRSTAIATAFPPPRQ